MLPCSACVLIGLALEMSSPKAIPPREAEAHEYRVGGVAMGTVLDVTVVAADAPLARRLAEAAIEEARRWDHLLTTWRPDGELARFNQGAGSGSLRVSHELRLALGRMRALAAETGGAFDPAVGPLVTLWQATTAPIAQQLATLPRNHIARALALDAGDRASLVHGAALDPGGIGKGMALDAIAVRLRAGGARAAFLNFGRSSQLAIGAPSDDPAGWKVVVTGKAKGSIHGVLHLRDASLSMSSSSGPGDQAGPIVDPKQGRPVPAGRTATVLARDATSADAWSTALVVLGAAGRKRARAAGLEWLLEEGDRRWSTPKFAALMSHSASDRTTGESGRSSD